MWHWCHITNCSNPCSHHSIYLGISSTFSFKTSLITKQGDTSKAWQWSHIHFKTTLAHPELTFSHWFKASEKDESGNCQQISLVLNARKPQTIRDSAPQLKAPTSQSAFHKLFYSLPQCFKTNEDWKNCSEMLFDPAEQSLKKLHVGTLSQCWKTSVWRRPGWNSEQGTCLARPWDCQHLWELKCKVRKL